MIEILSRELIQPLEGHPFRVRRRRIAVKNAKIAATIDPPRLIVLAYMSDTVGLVRRERQEVLFADYLPAVIIQVHIGDASIHTSDPQPSVLCSAECPDCRGIETVEILRRLMISWDEVSLGQVFDQAIRSREPVSAFGIYGEIVDGTFYRYDFVDFVFRIQKMDLIVCCRDIYKPILIISYCPDTVSRRRIGIISENNEVDVFIVHMRPFQPSA